MINLLKGTRTYLIGPIEYDSDGRLWREKVSQKLRDIGVITFDPYEKPILNATEESNEIFHNWKALLMEGRFDEVADFAKKIRGEDLRMTDLVDFAFAYLNPKIPTFGSIEELVQICRAKKPVFLVIEGGKQNCPLWILGMFPHKYIYSSFEEAIEMLNSIDSGKTDMDNHRWKLLKPEFR